jgi:hypothetical protein
LTVAEAAGELHPEELLIITLYVAATRPDLVFDGWKVAPLSKLYVSPAFWTFTVMVPVDTVQVGCITDANVGSMGAALTVTVTGLMSKHPAAVVPLI